MTQKTPSRIHQFDDEGSPAVNFKPSPLPQDYAERLKYYQQQREQKMKKLEQEMNAELTLKPNVPDTSKQMAEQRATRLGELVDVNASERMFNAVYQKHKVANEEKRKQKEEAKKKATEVKEGELKSSPGGFQNKLTDAEKEELLKQGMTFKPTINTNVVVDHGDKTTIQFLEAWEKIRREKIKKLARDVHDKEALKATGIPERPAKEKGEQYLKNKEVEQMRVEDRIFKRAADNMKKYKGVESKDAEEATFQPEINETSKQLVASKMSGNIFDELYQKGISKIELQKANELKKKKLDESALKSITNTFQNGPAEPGREVEIFERHEQAKQKNMEKEVKRMLFEEQQRVPQISQRSLELAEVRKQKLEQGTFKRIKKSTSDASQRPKTLLCDGTIEIMKNKTSQIPATDRLYNYSKILQQQKSLPVEEEQFVFKPQINTHVRLDTTFEERNDELLRKRMRLLELKRERELEQEAKELAYTYQPKVNASTKSVSKILYESSMTTASAKVSQQAALANDKFIQRMQQSRRFKEESQQRQQVSLAGWSSIPTQQQPFAFKRASDPVEASLKPNPELFDFLEQIVDFEIQQGMEDARRPAEEKESTVDVRATTREAARLGDINYKVEDNGAFTMFHKISGTIVHNLFDQVEYAQRRKTRKETEKVTQE